MEQLRMAMVKAIINQKKKSKYFTIVCILLLYTLCSCDNRSNRLIGYRNINEYEQQIFDLSIRKVSYDKEDEVLIVYTEKDLSFLASIRPIFGGGLDYVVFNYNDKSFKLKAKAPYSSIDYSEMNLEKLMFIEPIKSEKGNVFSKEYMIIGGVSEEEYSTFE